MPVEVTGHGRHAPHPSNMSKDSRQVWLRKQLGDQPDHRKAYAAGWRKESGLKSQAKKVLPFFWPTEKPWKLLWEHRRNMVETNNQETSPAVVWTVGQRVNKTKAGKQAFFLREDSRISILPAQHPRIHWGHGHGSWTAPLGPTDDPVHPSPF